MLLLLVVDLLLVVVLLLLVALRVSGWLSGGLLVQKPVLIHPVVLPCRHSSLHYGVIDGIGIKYGI